MRALCEPIVVGMKRALQAHAGAAALKRIRLVETPPREFHIGVVHADNGRAAIDAARTAIRGALAGEYAAVVAAPHSEAAIRAAGIEFDGYPSFVAREAGRAPEDGILMLCFRHGRREVRIAHVTLHSSVAAAVELITTQRVLRTIRAVHDALENPRIAVSGLNPHAVGAEEQRVIAPAIRKAKKTGIDVDGPIGADTLLQRAEYDAYIVMLHDQGHVAAKLLAPNRAAALTIGTPVVFSSVAHGAAFDIAGRGRADAAAMVEAITRLVTRRRRTGQTRRNY